MKELIKQMKSEYPANTYHLTKRCAYLLLLPLLVLALTPPPRNCNHFSDDFCRRLTNTGIPGWVNRFASLLLDACRAIG